MKLKCFDGRALKEIKLIQIQILIIIKKKKLKTKKNVLKISNEIHEKTINFFFIQV